MEILRYNLEQDFETHFKDKLNDLIDHKYKNLSERKRRPTFKKEFAETYFLDYDKVSNTVNGWLSRGTVASFENLVRICNFFNCDMDYLISNQDCFSKGIAGASEVTGLEYITIEELSKLSTAEKHIVDAICSRTIISHRLIQLIKEMLYYAHPITKNNSHIVLDLHLTARDQSYQELEHELNKSELLDIFSNRLVLAMHELLDTLFKDTDLLQEISADYRNKYFKEHKLLSSSELPKLLPGGELDIPKTIENLEDKILDRLKERESASKLFPYPIENLKTSDDFSKIMQSFRNNKKQTPKEYLELLEKIDDATK